MRRKVPHVLEAVVLTYLLVLNGCSGVGLGGPGCGGESRDIRARGSTTQAGLVLVTADMLVVEFREPAEPTSLSYTIQSASMKGQVTSIVLVNTANPSAAIVELTLSPPTVPFLAQGTTRGGSILVGLFDLLGANKLAVRVTPDTPGASVVTIPLTTYSQTDWARPKCG